MDITCTSLPLLAPPEPLFPATTPLYGATHCVLLCLLTVVPPGFKSQFFAVPSPGILTNQNTSPNNFQHERRVKESKSYMHTNTKARIDQVSTTRPLSIRATWPCVFH